MAKSSDKNRWIGFAILGASVILLSLAGYIGYAVYPRFDLPQVSGIGLYMLAAGAGLGSFFSPCSFPLLATLLARSIDSVSDRTGIRNALRYGAALAAGVSVFLLLTGAGIAAGGGALFTQVTFTSPAGRLLRIVVGAFLMSLGLIQIGAIPSPFDHIALLAYPLEKTQAKLRREHPTMGFALYGFIYILAGFG